MSDQIRAENKDKAPLNFGPGGQEEFTKSFISLRDALCSAPILAFSQFDSPEPCLLNTDWSFSNKAIGAVLSQVQDGKERVIAYGAKKLTTAQANYAPTKGELCAIIVFIRQWNYYLQNRPFFIRTDHAALKYMNTLENPVGMVQRWLQTLSNHQYVVKHRAGKSHGNADALSRAGHIPPSDGSTDMDENVSSILLEDKSMVHLLDSLTNKPGATTNIRSLYRDPNQPIHPRVHSLMR
jgi:hypothetical protein